MKRTLKWGGIILLSIITAYIAVIEYPSFLFSNSHTNRNVVIYSDKALDSNIDSISDDIVDRIKKSDYYNDNELYQVYISNDYWRWSLLSNSAQNAGGINYCLFQNNSFIRPSVIQENRIIPPGDGLADAKQRDLVYFISHEIAHGMMCSEAGHSKMWLSAPLWLREGYADYVGKETFNFADNHAQFIRGEHRLTEASGLYVRYHLYVAYLLDYKGFSIDTLISNPPSIEMVESELANLSIDHVALNK